jgi:hypothetical protein
MTEAGLKKIVYTALTTAIVFLIVVYIIALAIRDGTIWSLLAGVVIVVLVTVFAVERLTVALRNLKEAIAIGQATSYQVTHNGRQRSVSLTIGQPAREQLAPPPTPDVYQAWEAPAALTDPRRRFGAALLEATLNHPQYGKDSHKLITQAEAIKVGVISNGNEHKAGVGYLTQHFAMYSEPGQGVYTKGGKSISDINLELGLLAPYNRPTPVVVDQTA